MISLIRFDLIIYVSAVRVLINHTEILKLSLQIQSHTVLSHYWSYKINFCVEVFIKNFKLDF